MSAALCAPPSPASGATSAALLRSRFGKITCSWRWTEDFAVMVEKELLPTPASSGAARRLLFSTKHYPPGGSRTSMVDCPGCGKFAPRNQGEGSSVVCVDCYYEMSPPERWARLPSSPRFDQPQTVRRVGSELAEGILRLRSRKSMSTPAKAIWFAPRDTGLTLLTAADQMGRSHRRPLYLRADPRICGGTIDADGVMHDPWLGPIAPVVVLEKAIAA